MGKPKVLVIVGPTASGKTSLSIELARRFHGEIISADSRQVYRGLDLGSGKVTRGEMDGIPHHMLDVCDPSSVYTVSDYVRDASQVLTDIMSRGKFPIIVGGSFFYVDALLGRVSLPEVPPNPALRASLDSKSTEELYSLLSTQDPRRAETVDRHNRPRLMRALEISAELGAVPLPKTPESRYDTLILGMSINRHTLFENIHARLIDRIERGMTNEVKQLHEHGLSYDRLESLGLEYRYIARHLTGELPFSTMLDLLETKIRQFAKRQMTWLKRDSSIVWVNPADVTGIENRVRDFLTH